MSTELPPIEDDDEVEQVQLGGSRLNDDEMDITPMIDITFLLLIFFLVASKMDPDQAVDLPPAKHGGAVVNKNAVILFVTRGSGERAIIKAEDGTEFNAPDIDDQEQEIVDYLVAQLAGPPPKSDVLVKGEIGVKMKEMKRVHEAVARAAEEGQRLHIAVEEKK